MLERRHRGSMSGSVFESGDDARRRAHPRRHLRLRQSGVDTGSHEYRLIRCSILSTITRRPIIGGPNESMSISIALAVRPIADQEAGMSFPVDFAEMLTQVWKYTR